MRQTPYFRRMLFTMGAAVLVSNAYVRCHETHSDADTQVQTQPSALVFMEQQTTSPCPPLTLEVSGKMRLDSPMLGSIEDLQWSTCDIVTSDDPMPKICKVFNKQKWEQIVDKLPKSPEMHFCIDKYEAPNVPGFRPQVMTTWYEASNACKSEGKRLCSEDEWTFACEGPETLPYPYGDGYVRDNTACNFDKDRPVPDINESLLLPRGSERSDKEVERVWMGELSGTRPRCVSPFGVYDMTGNVDELTVAVHPSPYKSVLKGGYWSKIRSRCRPATRAHSEGYVGYQAGFRCCSDLQKDEKVE